MANSRKPRNRKPKEREERREHRTVSTRGETKGKGNEPMMGELPKDDRSNDPNWYFTDSRLAEQASQLSFQQMLGGANIVGNAQVPTIMTLYTNPSPGVSYDWTQDSSPAPYYVRDGLNMMSSKLYTLLSTFSGRTSSYAPQDVGTALLAMSSAAEIIEFIRRAFGVAMTYNIRNRAYPKAVIDAMGIDADDLFSHMADYRMRMNTYVARINQIPLLDNVGFIRKSREMYQKIYLDDPSSMAQTFMYVPNSVWVIDETSYQSGTILKTVEVCMPIDTSAFKVWTLDDLMDQVVDPIIEGLVYSSTLNIVYADLLNLANKVNIPLFKFDYIDENYSVVPEYNRNACLQLHNLSFAGPITSTQFVAIGNGAYMTPSNDVYPDANVNGLIYNPGFGDIRQIQNNLIVDMDTDTPDIIDRLEALRLTTGISESSYASGGDTYYTGVALPDHWVSCAYVFGRDGSGSGAIVGTRSSTINTMINAMASFSQFKSCPTLYVGGVSPTNIYGELNYYTVVNSDYIRRLNRLMYTGLFDFRS